MWKSLLSRGKLITTIGSIDELLQAINITNATKQVS